MIIDEHLDTSKITLQLQITRNEGVTEAERYLNSLCESTFLSLWSYPGLYIDKKSNGGNQGKELCDLLVVFGDHIIIFSDKDCEFKYTGNIETDWKRWFKKAVVKSADQLWGAESWIKKFPERIFLDKNCTQLFPYDLPKPSKAKFHLVVVAHDVSKICAEAYGGSGSLMIQSNHIGINDHLSPPMNGESAIARSFFTVGDLDPSRTFVHILDDTSLNIVFKTLDTISDFTAYLEKKEIFLRAGHPVVMSAGEEELLANYLIKVNDQGEHDFDVPENIDLITYDEGQWEHFQTSPQRKGQIEKDRVSYFWDALIEQFNIHALKDTQQFAIPSGIKTTERVMRVMASESRLRRRMLGEMFLNLIKTIPKDKSMTRYSMPTRFDEPAYAFFVLSKPDSISFEDYREVRRTLLSHRCRVMKHKFNHLQTIIGIATESGFDNPTRSEDALFVDGTQWSEEDYKEAEQLQKETRLLENFSPTHYHAEEYPEVRELNQEHDVEIPKKFPRNSPCPCGSGVKFKKCHGRN